MESRWVSQQLSVFLSTSGGVGVRATVGVALGGLQHPESQVIVTVEILQGYTQKKSCIEDHREVEE